MQYNYCLTIILNCGLHTAICNLVFIVLSSNIYLSDFQESVVCNQSVASIRTDFFLIFHLVFFILAHLVSSGVLVLLVLGN